MKSLAKTGNGPSNNFLLFYKRFPHGMAGFAKGRKVMETQESYQVRDPAIGYNAHFYAEKNHIGFENIHFGSINECPKQVAVTPYHKRTF